MVKNTRSLFLFVISIFLLASGCSVTDDGILPTVSPEFNGTVLLSDHPCSAPCWQGLEMGVSTEEEVLETISSFSFVNHELIRVIPQTVPDMDPKVWVSGKNIVVPCTNRPEPCMRLTIADDHLRDIDIILDNGLVLEALIQRFGTPDFLGSHGMGGDVIDCRVELMWVKQQIVVYSKYFSKAEDIERYCIAVDKDGAPYADLIIAEVRYLPAEDIHARVESGRLIEFLGIKEN